MTLRHVNLCSKVSQLKENHSELHTKVTHSPVLVYFTCGLNKYDMCKLKIFLLASWKRGNVAAL